MFPLQTLLQAKYLAMLFEFYQVHYQVHYQVQYQVHYQAQYQVHYQVHYREQYHVYYFGHYKYIISYIQGTAPGRLLGKAPLTITDTLPVYYQVRFCM